MQPEADQPRATKVIEGKCCAYLEITVLILNGLSEVPTKAVLYGHSWMRAAVKA